jgi:hypothetical protein
MCLPVVVCNLGSEMLYILEQRLRAQNITSDKSVKVLHDVVKSMFDRTFVAELFKPQELYTQRSTRQIFDKLAHSSIMRLSASSMDKLYDLMTMGFKFQLVSCSSPQEVLTVTLTHLVTVRSYLTDPDVIALVDNFEAALRTHFGGFTVGEWYALRQTLHRFLTNKQVKVSLFLQEGIQHSDGRIKLPSSREVDIALGAVGAVRRYDVGGGSGGGGDCTQLEVAYGVKSQVPHPVPLGGNMYAKDRQAPSPAPLAFVPRNGEFRSGGGDWAGNAAATPAAGWDGGARSPPAAETVLVTKGNAEAIMEHAGKGAANELNALAGLIRPSAPVDTFKLNLFGEGSAVSSSGAGGGGGGGASKGTSPAVHHDVIQFDGDAGNKASGLADIMGSFSVGDPSGAAAGQEEEDDDLLALMDAA